MKSHAYLIIATTLAALCFLIMLAVTVIWMYVPTRIVYQESSPKWTESYSIEVKEQAILILSPRTKS